MSSIPPTLICPITQDLIQTPVLLVEDGQTYEKCALERWFETNNTSPITNKQLTNKKFVTNYALKSIIDDFLNKQNETETGLNSRSFTIKQGRPTNNEWGKLPKLNIIISLLGPQASGKSSLANNVEYAQPQAKDRFSGTVGIDIYFFYVDTLFENKYVVIIQINDCPSEHKFEAISDRHFRNCHGAVLMADTNEIESFQQLENYWYKQLKKKSKFDNFECVLACNKIDELETKHDSSYRETFFKEADKFASRHQIPIFNISALRGDNIHIMFNHLILSILKNKSLIENLKENEIGFDENQSTSRSNITLNVSSKTSKKQEKSSCC